MTFAVKKIAALGGAFLLIFLLSSVLFAQEGNSWSRPLPISGALSGSWYPTIAVDDEGMVHVIWGVSGQPGENTLYYEHNDGLAWSRPVDILVGGPRSSMIIDGRDIIHLLYPGENTLVSDADIQDAASSHGWSKPSRLNINERSTNGRLLEDREGILHSVWIEGAKDCESCNLVGYKQSTDGGINWGGYHSLSLGNVDPQDVQIAEAPNGTLYAIWTTVVPANKDAPLGAGMNVSTDGGVTWLDEPIALRVPDEIIRQAAVGADKNNAAVLVYNKGNKDETFFQISTDNGKTFTDSAPIPGLFVAKPSTGTDYFALTNDSAGTLHLIAVGRIAKDQPIPGVYHLEWDGQQWSKPQTIYQGDQFPEFPAVAVGNGNRLHVVFATQNKDKLAGPPDASYQVWYSSFLTSAPNATRVPQPTFTPRSLAQPTVIAVDPNAGTPTRRPTATRIPIGAETTEEEDTDDTANPQLPIIIGVVPVILILILVIIFTGFRRVRR